MRTQTINVYNDSMRPSMLIDSFVTAFVQTLLLISFVFLAIDDRWSYDDNHALIKFPLLCRLRESFLAIKSSVVIKKL